MRRPFVGLGASLAAGILAGKLFPLPVFLLLAFLFVFLPLLWIFRGRPFFLPLFLVCFFGLGMIRIQDVTRLPAHHVSRFVQDQWVSLEGNVASVPELKEKGRRRIFSFILDSKRLILKGKSVSTTGKVQVFLFNPQEAPFYGARVSVRGKLISPRLPHNPGEFDYRNYLAQQGIYTALEGYGTRSLRILGLKIAFWHEPFAWVEKLRRISARRLDRFFSPPVDSLLKALILGIRKDLPENFRDDFIKTGTAHLIAISGMNITLVAGSLYFLALCLGLPQKGAAFIGLVSTASYVFLSGMGIPVIRAGWMAGIFFSGLLLEREKDLANSLFFALFAILLVDPLAVFQAGFQLSFLSVLSLVVFSRGLSELNLGRTEWLQTLTVMTGTFPLCIYYFNVFSWMSLFANLAAIPLFNLGNLAGLASLFLGDTPLVGLLLIRAASLFLKAGLAWIHLIAGEPWGYFHLRPPSRILFFSYYAALALVVALRQFPSGKMKKLKSVALSFWFITALAFFLPGETKNFSLTVLSAGHNEIVDVEFPGKNHWLVNGGRKAPSNQARWILSPLLRRAGVNRLGGILLTDFSGRHTGGFPTLLDNFSFGSILFPGDSEFPEDWNVLRKTSSFKRLASFGLYRGDKVSVDPDGKFKMVDVVEGRIFLLIEYRSQKFLLLPTLKPEILSEALPRLKNLGPVNVLVLPASGTPDRTQWEGLLSALVPDWVVFTAKGRSSRVLLPLLRREEVPFFWVSETGALRFELLKDGRQLSLTGYDGHAILCPVSTS